MSNRIPFLKPYTCAHDLVCFLLSRGHETVYVIFPKGILNIIFQQIIVLIFANAQNFLYLCSRMIVTFEQTYLQELYTEGKASDKKHRFNTAFSLR